MTSYNKLASVLLVLIVCLNSVSIYAAGGKKQLDNTLKHRLNNPIYTEIHPQYRLTDVNSLIDINNLHDISIKRERLRKLIEVVPFFRQRVLFAFTVWSKQKIHSGRRGKRPLIR